MADPRDPDACGHQGRLAMSLAARDFAHEWRLSLCQVFALTAVLAPLLILLGLKSGLIRGMTERLRADPVNRELILRGHQVLPGVWFTELGRRPEVGFLVPRTRSLSATMTLEGPAGRVLSDVDLIPSAAGDPLVPAGTRVPAGEEVLLTHTAAVRLGAGVGTRLDGVVERRIDGRASTIRVPLRVAGVLPERTYHRDAALVSLSLLVATENFRDGADVPLEEFLESSGASPAVERSFASARLYARDIVDVAPLARHLRERGLEVVTHAREIEMVTTLDHVLTLLFVVLATISGGGYLLSLAATSWANVDRKTRDIALLRLLGVRAVPILVFAATHNLLAALGGIGLSGVVYVLTATAFNRAIAVFRGESLICRLLPAEAAAAVSLTVGVVLLASLAGGARASRIDPADTLRTT